LRSADVRRLKRALHAFIAPMTCSASMDATAEVLLAERAWLEAHLRLDVSTLQRLMADEFTQIGSNGVLLRKNDVLASFAGGQRKWDHAESDEYRVQIYGSTALVCGRWRAKGINSGHHFDYAARYVAVWVRREGRWQLVSDQSTPISGSP
jgi:ketosteroid isomerase-like protein